VRTCRTTRWPRWAAVVLVILAFSLPSFAGLGGYADSVEADRVKMKATLKVRRQRPMRCMRSKHPREPSSGSTFLPTDGFLAWHGEDPSCRFVGKSSDRSTGQYADAIRTGKANLCWTAGPWPFSSLVCRPGCGHMLGHFGRAYLPDMLPEGVSSDAIR